MKKPAKAPATSASTPKAVKTVQAAKPAPESKAPTPESKTPAAKKTAVRKAAPKPKAPAEPVSAPLTTRVVAEIDIGFGHLLFLRGEGAGLSWERGVPMECVNGYQWTWTTTEASAPLKLKVLVDDQTWNTGDDLTAEPGTTFRFVPSF